MGLPKHWKNVQFKEIASLRRENIKPTDFPQFNYVGLEHIDSGESQLKRWGDASEVKSAKSHFYPNDVLYGKLRSYLDKAVTAEMEGICSTDILVVTANPKTIPRFLVYLLHTHSFISHAVATSTGVNHPRTSWNSLGKFTLALPPFPEQRAIASVLGAIQEAKFARQKEIALERERKAALMDHLFSHGTKGEPRKQTEIGEVPESWAVLKLGQLCRVFSGHGFKTKDYTQEGIPLIKIGNLQDGDVVINPNNDYMPESWQQKEQLQKFILKSKNILIALTGATTGKTAVVPPSLEGTFLNQRVGKIELISPNAKQGFILVVIKTRFFQEAIQQNILRSAQGNISPSSIAQIPIPLPLLAEQRTIASVFQAINGKTAALKEEAEHLDELFHAMLEELMTGKRSAVPLIDAELPN